jgi:cell division protease FtsH
MVCRWGMSDRLGPLVYGRRDEQIFLGKEFAHQRDYSEDTAKVIDEEVRAIVEKAEKIATEILTKNRDNLDKLAAALLEKEVLDGSQIDAIINGTDSDEVLKEEPAPKVDG